jgi:MoxR-like ATPase
MEGIRNEVSKVIVGQHKMLDLMLIGLLCDGHILIEGVPGVAKTLAAKLMAKIIDVDFSRIQFTPDLMPSDVVGTSVFNTKEGDFKFKHGPVFSNIVLIDEINRAPAKTQAALFEVMEERQVTVDGVTHEMRFPFLILATQNPIEQEGTYRLPEAQLDRFMFKVSLNYPSFAEEMQVVKNTTGSLTQEVSKQLNAEQIIYFQQLVRNIPVADNVLEYAVKLVSKTRPDGEFSSPEVKRLLNWGAGPRASQYLILGAKCHAVINGKYSPDIEDVQAVAKPILSHRIVRSYHAEAEGLSTDDIIERLF